MFPKKSSIIVMCIATFLMFACGSPKRITYLQDMEPYVEYAINQRNQLKIQSGDRLDIIVEATKTELTAPFNSRYGVATVSETGQVSSASSRQVNRGYLVDEDGNIDFPVLGRIHARGLTHKELSHHIEGELSSRGYINDATVTVELLNLQVVVLSEGSGSIVRATDDKLTLLEVTSRVNMDNIKMKEVAVIREEGEIRKMYTVNLQSVSLFDSPVYYLQQNDIVYMKPSSAGLPPRIQRAFSSIGAISGMLNLVLTYVLWQNR